MFSKKQETLGVIFVLASAMVSAVGPIVANIGVKSIPPLMFVGVSFLMSALFFFFVCFGQKNFSQLRQKNTYKNIYFDVAMVTIFVVIIPYSLFFIGTTMTSGLNSSLLQLSELVFTLVLTYYIGEKNSLYKYLGAGGILIGSIFLMYTGTSKINFGDLIIILSAASFPFGNFYAKKALNVLSPSIILFSRYLIGGFFIFLMSIFFEDYSDFQLIFLNNWHFFIFYGLLITPLSTFLWYQSLKRLDITKAVSLNMLYPFFSVVILLILGQKINRFQFIGILIIFIGTYFSVKRPSTDPELTRYSQP